MSAFFSGTDLKDEVASRYFAVFGKVNEEVPEFVARIASNGQAKDVDWEDIFEVTPCGKDYSLNHAECMKRINEQLPARVTTKVTARQPYYYGDYSEDSYRSYSYGSSSYTQSSTNPYYKLIGALSRLNSNGVYKINYNPELMTEVGQLLVELVSHHYPDKALDTMLLDLDEGIVNGMTLVSEN